MPETNLEIVRGLIQAAVEGDWARLGPALDIDVVLDQKRPSGVYRGRSGVQVAMERWSEAWEDRRLETEEFIDAGDRVVVIAHEYVKSERMGMVLDRRIAEVWTLRHGKVVSIRDYGDRDEALAAAGVG